MKPHNIIRLALIFLTTQLLGCSSKGELERVAKDWCTTIRASQVIPVYPLTEDLEPGDAFLVQIPLSRQVEQYEQKGFLPFDMHLARLKVSEKDYNDFYDGFYGLSSQSSSQPSRPPHIWQKQDESAKAESNQPSKPKRRHIYPTYWHKAPHAAFPTYTFKVQRGGAFQAALPIKGIPVALGLLAADKATGSVTIEDSYTYGIPYEKLVQHVALWAERNKTLLKDIRTSVVEAEPFMDKLWRAIAGPSERTIYLRIISRIYLAGSMTVSVTNTGAGAVKAATKSFGGKMKESPDFNSVEDVNDYTQRLKALNDSLKLQYLDVNEDFNGFGASLNITWATYRSIGIDEQFDRPLVIGYLAFDFPVLDEGQLGIPVVTLNQLSSNPVPTKLTRLPSSSSPILTGLLQKIRSHLMKVGTTRPEIKSYIENMDTAAGKILSYHAFTPRYRYTYNSQTLKLQRSESDEGSSDDDFSKLIGLWDLCYESATFIDGAIAAIEDGKSVTLEDFSDGNKTVLGTLEKGKPLKIEGKTVDPVSWLKQNRDAYLSLRKQLDEEIQTCPEIIKAVDFYFSLFKED